MDNQKIQEHVQKLKGALGLNGEDIVPAPWFIAEKSREWHQQSIEIIEQQQREIERLIREYDELEDQAYRWKEESGN